MREAPFPDIFPQVIFKEDHCEPLPAQDAEEQDLLPTVQYREVTPPTSSRKGPRNRSSPHLQTPNHAQARTSQGRAGKKPDLLTYYSSQLHSKRLSSICGAILKPFSNHRSVSRLRLGSDELFHRLWAIPYATRLTVYIFLLLFLVCIQLLYGILFFEGDSLSYALRTLVDSAGLVFALVVMTAPTWRSRKHLYPYGYVRFQLLAALINCLYTFYSALWSFVEGIHDFYDPQLTHKWTIIHCMLIELGVNLTGLILFASYRNFGRVKRISGSSRVGPGHALNLHGILLHSLAHLLNVTSALIDHWHADYFTANPRVLLLINILMFLFLVHRCRPCLWYLCYIFLQTTPDELQYYLSRTLDEVRTTPGVIDHHSAHWWTVDGANSCGSLCVSVRPETDPNAVRGKVEGMLRQVRNFTLQLEPQYRLPEVLSSKTL